MPKTLAKFYGMIANIDENLGRFRARLAELGLAENTLLIFLTDNGTTAGWIDQQAGYKYFNAGMRGWKGSAYDGGHRVPCFWYWPAGGLSGGRDVKALTAHIDILPTLVDLLGLEKPAGRPVDGISLRAALEGRQESLPERTLVRACAARLPAAEMEGFRRHDPALAACWTARICTTSSPIRASRPTSPRNTRTSSADCAGTMSIGGPRSNRRRTKRSAMSWAARRIR